MKNIIKTNIYLILFLSFTAVSFVACEKEKDEDPVIETRIVERIDTLTINDTIERFSISIEMKQKANGNDLMLNTTNKPYTNANGQAFNVSRLRYLISDVGFHKADGSCFTINDYHFVDITDTATLNYQPSIKVPEGDYVRISFNFGFDREDNQSGAYPTLNAESWNWNSNLGGGYHFMQLEGQYDSSGVSKNFLTHMGTARNNNVSPTTYEDNHFRAYVDTNITVDTNFNFAIVMNVEQWYEDPYTWDFNVYNTMIMPNYDAQRKLNLNGPSVFTIE
jgi:hypothetical protein